MGRRGEQEGRRGEQEGRREGGIEGRNRPREEKLWETTTCLVASLFRNLFATNPGSQRNSTQRGEDLAEDTVVQEQEVWYARSWTEETREAAYCDERSTQSAQHSVW